MKWMTVSSRRDLQMVCASVAVLVVAFLTFPRSARAEPPLGSRSFLTRHVHSVAELKRELASDPRLLRIYSELLHMSPEVVKAEFSRLKLVRLPEEGAYKVYGVYATPQGLQYSFKVRRLPKGIDVFVLPDGTTPVILKQCGNLLRGYFATPGPVANSVPAFNELSPDAGLAQAPGSLPETITLDTPVANEWGWVEDTLATAPSPAIFPPPGLVASRIPAPWWPWLFPLVGVPFIGGGGGGGGLSTFGGPLFFIPDTSSALAAIVQPSFEIPEPGTIAWLVSLSGTSAAILLWRRGKLVLRRRQRQL